VAPLAIKSLQKSYMIHNFGDNCPYSAEELITIVVEQNEVELFLHGEEQFNYYNEAVRGSMVDAGLSNWVPPYKTWEQVGDLLESRTCPTFYPNLTTQAGPDEPRAKRQRTTGITRLRKGKIEKCLFRNSSGVITVASQSEPEHQRVQTFMFDTDPDSLSRLHGLIGKLLANNSNTTNGMMSSANIMHDNPSALAWSSSRGATLDASRDIYQGTQDSMQTYLERPVLVAAMQWGIGANLYNKYTPLKDILTSTPIRNKLQNFENILFELDLDFEVSANPFLYGMLLINWVPFPKYDSITKDRGLIYEDNVEASQRQKLFIDASTSSGGSMTIPFYWPTNYFNLVKDNPEDFGYLSVRQLNPLMHVSGVNQTVTVYIRAKLRNVRLHTSTSQELASQFGMSVQADESPNDKLSSTASRVADIAQSLTPVLGGYATATSVAARSAAGILRAMGLSHPRSKEMAHRFENRPLGNMSNYNAPSSAFTLGLDENNEVTIDPGVASLVEDEMSIGHITKMETFIGTYDWDITADVGTVLASHIVHPFQYAKNSASEYHLSPMAYMARMFQFWTGTIKFRFQIVCSKWHRGRLRILHDPVYVNAVANSAWQTNLQSIVDITDERDFTIEVKYVQGQLYCQTGNLRTAPPSFYTLLSGLDYTPNALFDANGLIKVIVMNKLVIPDDTVSAPCHINVFVSAGEDFELAVPLDNLSDFTLAAPTADVNMQSIATTNPVKAMVLGSITEAVNYVYDPVTKIMTPNLPVGTSGASIRIPWYYGTVGGAYTGSLSLKNTGSTALNVSATTPGGASLVNIPAGATGIVIIKNDPSPGPNQWGVNTIAIAHDGAGVVNFVLDSAVLPVKPGFQWVSAIDSSYTYLRRDGQQDAISNPTPPPTYPVVFNLTGAPTVYWKVGGSTNLYQPGNYGAPVFALTNGPVRVTEGIYGPTRVAWNSNIPKQQFNTPDQGTLYSNTTFQLAANFAVSTTVKGIVYDVMFLQPALTTQADEQDMEIADPNSPPTQATMHETHVPKIADTIYFGEKILHLRQILGRPQYHTTYALTGGSSLRRHRIVETDIPEYPSAGGILAATTPFYFMMGCYNGWRGTIRSKYVFNGAAANIPAFARLERNQVGFNTRVQSSNDYNLATAGGLAALITTTSSMWNGAIVTNPQLANELNAEFPYYYRYRFRSARPLQMGGRASSTNSHTLTVDMVGTGGPVYVERYFQPGEDFTLLNWVGTPVLY
jgi:hypothetical protein